MMDSYANMLYPLDEILGRNFERKVVSYPSIDILSPNKERVEPEPVPTSKELVDLARLLIPDLRDIAKDITKEKLYQAKVSKAEEEVTETMKKMAEEQYDLFKKRQDAGLSLASLDKSYLYTEYEDPLTYYKPIDSQFESTIHIPTSSEEKVVKLEDDMGPSLQNDLSNLDSKILRELRKHSHLMKDLCIKKDQISTELPERGRRNSNVDFEITDKEREARGEQYEAWLIAKIELMSKQIDTSSLTNIRHKNKEKEKVNMVNQEEPKIIRRIYAEGVINKKRTLVDDSIYLERRKKVIEQPLLETGALKKVEDVSNLSNTGDILPKPKLIEEVKEPSHKQFPQHHEFTSTPPKRIRTITRPSMEAEVPPKPSNNVGLGSRPPKNIEIMLGHSRKDNEFYRPIKSKSKDIEFTPVPTIRAEIFLLPHETSEPMLGFNKNDISTKRKSIPPLSEDDRKEAEKEGVVLKSKRLIRHEIMGLTDKFGRTINC